MTDRHADSFQRTEVEQTQAAAPANEQKTPSIDNAGQAALADAQREFTVGGDTPDVPPARPSVPSAPRITDAIARIRSTARPSPFGVAQFPPLPLPPRMKP